MKFYCPNENRILIMPHLKFIFFYISCIFLFHKQTVFAQKNSFDSLKLGLKKAIQRGDRFAEAHALYELAQVQASVGSTFEALKNAQLAIDIFEKMEKKSEVYKTYMILSTVHQQLHNGDKILEYSLPGLAYAKQEKDTALLIEMLTAVGIGYDEKNDYATAAKYYLECAEVENKIGDSPALSYMNASSSLSMDKRITEGRRYAELAVKQSIEDQDSIVLRYAYGNLAFADILDYRLEDAEKALRKAEKIDIEDQDINTKRDMFLLNSILFAAKGDFKKAYLTHAAFYKIDSTMSSQERSAQFTELQTIYETERIETENAKLTSRVDRQRFYILAIITLLLVLGIFALQQRNRLTLRNQLLEAEKLRAEQTLHDFTQSLREKTDALERLKANIENNKISSEEKENILAQLSNANILTEEQWRDFREKFESVYVGFFKQFSQNVPDATEAEKRLAALVKLNLTNSEIASMLGISPESVYKSRYRLKKKLEGQTLEGLVSNM